MNLLLVLHRLAAVIWVGGMFFAYLALRPVAARVLPPPLRLTLWVGVFARFFVWVWLAVLLLPATGLAFLHFQGGLPGAAWNVHVMMALGFVMILIYCFIYLVLFQRLKTAVGAEDWARGGAVLARMRLLIAVNLTLGLASVAIARMGALFA
jgi:uncharacterized membrane protein